MGVVLKLYDRLTNALTGTGTGRDARSGGAYRPTFLTQYQIDAAYRGSGLMRKIIQIPALDMVREWRDWEGLDAGQSSAVFDEEKRLSVRQKIRQAEVLRGLGGGALILGLPGSDPSLPAPATVGSKGLAYINVVSRWHLTFEQLQGDATKDGYGEPEMWQLNTTTGQIPVHPSRVIPFQADRSAAIASITMSSQYEAFWGESAVAQVLDAVEDFDTARASFAALMHKARLLRIGIPGLMELSASPEGEAQVMSRLAILATAESIHNATIYDAGDEEGKGGEKIDDVSYNFAGAKDILEAYSQFVAAICDIPMTRMHGQSAKGLNSSGDSEQKDWNKMVRARQTLDLSPCLERLDRYLLPSAIGSMPKDASYDFAPLDTPTEKERADTFFAMMQGLEKLQTSATVPDQALSRGVQSYLIEEGTFPELETALNELSDEERYGITADPGDPNELDPNADPNEPAQGGGDPASAGQGGSPQMPPRRANPGGKS